MGKTIILILAVLTTALIGCGGPKTMQGTTPGEIPIWYENPPKDPNFLYAPNSQVSQDMQLAMDKATTDGRREIAAQQEVRVQALQKKFDEETGFGKDAELLQQFTQVTKTVVSTVLNGCRMINSKVVRDGEMWRAYVLMEYPVGAANQAFVQQLKANEKLYTRFRSTQAFKELEEEVAKYEEFKKQQGGMPEK
ncbi:MAG: hypothetical protein AB1393_07820 [Candidatus Edwardsbacteria bacterium]